jgi:hypothetical protein
MNIQIVKKYIEEYKREFNRVHNQEIYKWHAIKQFQENFDINSKDFYSNLETSLSKSDNLLVSRLYFPKEMLLENIEKTPERVREMFKVLYDEDFDFLERVENFRSEFGALSKENFPDKKNHYQDHRTVVVYLTLMYPERYFFYKFAMFKNFAEKVEYPYKPVKGRVGNVGQFHSLCELVRYEIEKDQDLLNLHESRLEDDSYRDKNHNVLTQDFIYAVAQHLNELPKQETQKSEIISQRKVSINELTAKSNNIPNFKPIITNHIQNNIQNKRIGDLGEIWVLKQEKDFLIKNGKENLAEKVFHSAKNEGDGLGYDILSYKLNGEKKYIEVKTTKGRKNSTFYISRNELERSKIEADNYYLYRVYEFNEETEKGKILKIIGDLSDICVAPINYKVTLAK